MSYTYITLLVICISYYWKEGNGGLEGSFGRRGVAIQGKRLPRARRPGGDRLSGKGSVEPVDQVHPAPQECLVGDRCSRPAGQDAIDSPTFAATKLVVLKIGIMNNLGDRADARIPDSELLAQGLKGAVVPTMSESRIAEHVKRDGLLHGGSIACKPEAGPGIDESTDQPGRRRAIDPGPWARQPRPALKTFLRVEALPRRHRSPRGLLVKACQKAFRTVAEWTVKEIDGQDLLEASAEPGPASGRRVALGGGFPEVAAQPFVVARSSFDEELGQLFRGEVIDGMDQDHGRLPSILSYRSGQPFKVFEIFGRGGEKVS